MIEPQQAAPDEAFNRFLHLCLAGRWDPTALQAARTLTMHSDLDWDALRQVTCIEGLAPLLYPILRGQDVVPSPLEQELRNAYYRTAGRNTLLLRELGDVLRRLAAKSVAVIVLKGAALAETVYGDIAVRPMSDLDLLIRQQDLPVTRQVLAALGYTPVGVEMRTGFTVKFGKAELLFKPGLVDIHVDLHWRLGGCIYYQRAFPMDWFWETALPAQIGGAPARVLGCEAQLLHLCAHLLQHYQNRHRLLWLHDVAEVIAFYQAEIDWEQLLAQAQVHNLVLPVQQTLTRVADEWHAPIPSDVQERLRVLHPSHDERWIFTCITAKQWAVARRFWADLVSIPGWQRRLRYAWDRFFPSPAYMQHRYHIPHPLLVPLYYPYRWLSGLRRAPSSQLVPRRRGSGVSPTVPQRTSSPGDGRRSMEKGSHGDELP